MSWFGWGGSSATADVTAAAAPLSSDAVSPELQLHATDDNSASSSGSLGTFGFLGGAGAADSSMPPPEPVYAAPVLALDQIKSAGVPLNRQMSPYLQIDPSMFANSQPQYIMPDGGTTGKGKFEFALGHIGWAVGGGYLFGCFRGAIPEMFNPETKQLGGKPWLTRMVNATVKHGSGYAQPAGTAVFMYSAIEIGLRSLRAEDDLNSLFAGALTGAIYRSPHGLRATGIGAGVGMALSTAWLLVNPDSRNRIKHMLGSDAYA